MTVEFERPVGAPADVKELEYVSALTQTAMPELRINGSLHVEDVVNYLASRHGIRADPVMVEKDIMTDLAGDFESNPTQVIDLCQVLAILLIPHFKKTADSDDEGKVQSLFGKGLEVILAELPIDSSHFVDGKARLSTGLIQDILLSLGEYDVAPQIIEDMLRVAGGENQILDVPTFIQALTSDLEKYDTSRENALSTHFEDATQHERHQDPAAEDEEKIDPTKEISDDGKHGLRAIKHHFVFSSLDVTAETYSSQNWVSLTWVLVVLLYFAYLWGSNGLAKVDCTKFQTDFSCKVVGGIVQWLVIFIQLSFVGFAFVGLSSFGNSIYNSKGIVAFLALLVGMATLGVTTVASFFVDVETRFVNTHKAPGFEIAYYTIIIVGCTLIGFQVVQLIHILLPASCIEAFPRFSFLFIPSTIKMERRIKLAASHKIEKLVHNALAIHETPVKLDSFRASSTSKVGTALLNYQARENEIEPCGGILWAWKRIYNGSIFREEGVWLHARLIASNMSQVFVAFFLTVIWGLVTFNSERILGKDETTAPTMQPTAGTPYPTPLGFTAFPTIRMTYVPTPAPTPGEEFITKAEINVGVSTGAAVALFACLSIVVIYLPSSISTILQFRSGVLPSLRSKDFLQYRFAADQTTSLFGSAFWGAFYTCVVTWGVCGIFAFLIVWRVTRSIVTLILAQILGVIITIIVKMVVLIVLRSKFFAAFYRIRPGAANIMGTMLECWNLGLATGYMLLRSVKLVLVTAFYIGRIDTPMLAQGVGQFGPIILDAGPFAFQKDLLIHDAHRHPYIERLGLLYMLKLRYGEAFATRAGSCWRLLFTLALMPWIRKYRIRSFGESLENKADEDKPEESLTDELGLTALIKAKSLRPQNGAFDDALEDEVVRLRERVAHLEDELRRARQERDVFHDADSFKDEPSERTEKDEDTDKGFGENRPSHDE